MSVIAFKCEHCHCKFILQHNDYSREALLGNSTCPYCQSYKLREIPYRGSVSVNTILTSEAA